MNAKRIVLASVVGAIAMFVWTSIAHVATPLGRVGMQEIPNEGPVIAALQSSLGSSTGLYIYPGMGEGPDAMKNYQALLDKNPSGILIYKPVGQKALAPSQLGSEFAWEFLETLLLAVLLSMTALSTMGSRVGFAVVVGLIAAASTNLSYWTWYSFPLNYTIATMFVEVMKYLIAGIVIALMMGKGDARSRTAVA